MIDAQYQMQVARVIDALSSSGIEVAESDLIMLRAFSRQTVSATDMLAHAHQFVSVQDYEDWQKQQAAVSGDGEDSAATFERVLEELEDCLRRKYATTLR